MKRTAAPRPCLQCGAPITWECACCGDCNYLRFHFNGRAKAGNAVAKAIKEGQIKPAHVQLCIDCGAPAKEYDHRDYNQPLKVDPVCRSCNRRRGPGKWVKYSPIRELRKLAA